MDVALALENLLSAARYSGSLTDNTQAAYDAVTWLDDRAKPEWSAIIASADGLMSLDAVNRVNIAKDAVVSFAEKMAEKITGKVPMVEKLGWSIKTSAARAILAGAASDAQSALIAAEASLTGEDVNALAQTIVSKAALYERAVAVISGMRRATTTSLDALGVAPSQQQIDAVMASAKVQAEAQLTQLMAP